MVVLVNRAYVETATTGTGTLSLGAALEGYQSFADAGVSDGDTVRYVIEEESQWEIGSGVYSAGTLTRTVDESSNADSLITLAGAAKVFVTAAAEDLLRGVAYTKLNFTASGGQTTFSAVYTIGYVDVFLNGSKLGTADYTATDGTSVVLSAGASAGDLVEIIAWTTIGVDVEYVPASGGTFSGGVTFSSTITMSGDATFGAAIIEQVFALTGTTPALDPSNGTVQTHTLSGATTYTDSLSDGEAITLMVDDGAGQAVTWPTMTWINNAGAAPDLATTGYTTVQLWKVSTTLYGALVGDGS